MMKPLGRGTGADSCHYYREGAVLATRPTDEVSQARSSLGPFAGRPHRTLGRAGGKQGLTALTTCRSSDDGFVLPRYASTR